MVMGAEFSWPTRISGIELLLWSSRGSVAGLDASESRPVGADEPGRQTSHRCPASTTFAAPCGWQDRAAMSFSVLVVDDDPGFSDLAGRLLADLGLTVIGTAGTVAGAMATAERLRPSAALVDIGLPDGDGVDLAATLARLPWRPRVLLVSSDPDASTPSEARAVGAVGFLFKTELPTSDLRRMLTGEGDGPV
jgi:CheY-like chemotaxis protein